jgi:hypothetical protein
VAPEHPDEYVEIHTPDVHWRIERRFLASNWTCIWGRGCLGILDHPAPELGHGCCSVGAELGDEDEARLISALAQMLEPDRFQHHAEAQAAGIFFDERRTNTRVVDGACIFSNHPGFEGGAGCALHLAALDHEESPTDWKPSVCWQLPIKVDWEPGPGNSEIATLHGWTRKDWGEMGETMAWVCTEGTEAYVGDEPVIDSLAEPLEALLGAEVYVELRRRVR